MDRRIRKGAQTNQSRNVCVQRSCIFGALEGVERVIFKADNFISSGLLYCVYSFYFKLSASLRVFLAIFVAVHISPNVTSVDNSGLNSPSLKIGPSRIDSFVFLSALCAFLDVANTGLMQIDWIHWTDSSSPCRRWRGVP